MSKTAAEQRHMDRVSQLGCVVCKRSGEWTHRMPVELHHVAEGSSKRSNFAVVPLCRAHHDPHRTGSGFHGMGARRFCQIFNVPWLKEEGLLVWVNEDLAKVSA